MYVLDTHLFDSVYGGETTDVDREDCVLKHVGHIAQGADRESVLQKLEVDCGVTPVGNGTFEERRIMMLFNITGPVATETNGGDVKQGTVHNPILS